MSREDIVRVGIAGAAGRGGTFRAAFEANGARIHAVCDIQEEALDQAMRDLGADEKFTDFAQMIEKADLDGVVIGTPMHFHVSQSILALERGLHVLSEVPAAVSIEECQALVHACAGATGLYMMAENCNYIRSNVLVAELVRQGLFGQVYYAEGEYLHELKALNEITKWRRHWQTGIAGITYGTHNLGPILQWMPGDRVARVCCESTGSHYNDPRGEAYAQDSATMLCRTEKGALIKIRVDMISDRPSSLNYQLQGTDGAYESSRGGPGDQDKIWLRALSSEIRWHAVESSESGDSLVAKHLPAIWRDPPPEARAAGHAGSDYYQVLDFMKAIRGQGPCPIGIHEAMDMTLPGLVSQQSVLQRGAWLDVPNSRMWA